MSRIAKLMGRWLRPGNPPARKLRRPRLGLEAMEGRTLLSGVDLTAIGGATPIEVGAQAAAKVALKISDVDAYGIQGNIGTFTARLTNAATNVPVAGRLITFRIAGNRIGTARTDANGVATLSNVKIGTKAGVYPRRAVAVFNGTPRLSSALARGPLTVSRASSSMNSVSASGSFGGSGTFVAKLTSAGAGVQGRSVQFLIGSQVIATATTDARGFATVAGIDLSGRNVGSYTVRARFGGDAGFARSSSTGTLTLTKAAVNVTLGSLSATYDGTAHAASASVDQAGLAVAITYTDSSGNAVATPVKAGSYRVTATASDSNYSGRATGTLTIAKATLTAAGLNANKVYNGTTAAAINTAGATLSGVIAGDTVAISTTGVVANFAAKNVGTGLAITYTGLALSGADAANYALTNPAITGNITPAALIASGITANNKVYDGTTAATIDAFGASLSGTVPGDSITLNSAAAIGTFDSKNAGTSKVVNIAGLVLAGADAGNYTLSPVSLSASITRLSLTVSGITGVDKVYDAKTSASIDTSAATLSGVLAGDSVGIDGSAATGAFSSKNVGNDRPVTVSGLLLTGADSNNYVVGTTVTSANITKAPLSFTGVNANKVYDGTTNALLNTGGVAFNGLFAGDTVSLDTSGVTASFASKDVGTNLPVAYSGLALSGANAGNYALADVEIFGSISQATLTITGVTAEGKVYDGTTAATLLVTTPGVVGVFGTDDVSLDASGASVEFADKNAGVNKSVLVSGLSVLGADAGNYALDPTAKATITPRALTVNGVTAEGKVYDGTTAATVDIADSVLDESGILAGDSVAYSPAITGGVVATFADKNVGTGKPVTVTGLHLSGADAGNYAATATATADITKASLSASGVNANKVYDGTTNATLNTAGATFNGLATGDVVALDASGVVASFASKNVGTGLAVTYTGLVLAGADADNYTLTDPEVTGDISAATLTLSGVAATSRMYDGTTGATVHLSGASLVGVVSGEDVSFETGDVVGSFATKTAGMGKTVTVAGISLSGADIGNYVLAPVTTTANILKASLSVTGITADNKVYDGTTIATIHAEVAELDGVVTGDSVTLVTDSATGAFRSKGAGAGKTVDINGLALSGDDAENYELDLVTVTARIEKATLTVSGITAANKVFDGTTTAVIDTDAALLVGVIAGDDATLDKSAAEGHFDTPDVGADKKVTITGLVLIGVDADNYQIDPVTTSADITEA